MIMDLVVETALHSDQNITTELSSLLVQSEVILRINVTSLCHLIYIKCDCSFKVTRPTYFPITCPCSRLACCVTTGKPPRHSHRWRLVISRPSNKWPDSSLNHSSSAQMTAKYFFFFSHWGHWTGACMSELFKHLSVKGALELMT